MGCAGGLCLRGCLRQSTELDAPRPCLWQIYRFTATAANGKPGHGWRWGHAHPAQDVAVGCGRRARGFLCSHLSARPEQGARVTQGVSAQRLQSCGCSLCVGAGGPRSVPCFSPALPCPWANLPNSLLLRGTVCRVLQRPCCASGLRWAWPCAGHCDRSQPA